jgi:transcriptional regulator with XRE-family HTH domain
MKKLDQNKFNVQLGTVVRKLREEQELSRLTLAEISGVNEKYIGKIERGESSPSCFVLKKLSIGLSIQLSSLLNEL